MRKLIFILVAFACFVKMYGQPATYREKHRPQFHFSPPAHWMNDPNGMVYYKGEYHLFYQYYPDSTVWGPMHWGHAVTKDLVHWQHLPIALFPDSLGYIFSGSVVVDQNNTSGFQKGEEKPLVAIFTYHNPAGEKSGRNDFQSQGIAYSIDKGRTWKKYSGNPVIKNPGTKDFRDPKVMWHEASRQWILTMAVANKIQFYHSTDLKKWELSGSFGLNDGSHGGVWECPDLFQLHAVDGNESKWVLLVSIDKGAPNGGSGTQYFIGNFDGKTFINDHSPKTVLWLDYGCDDYAGVTWNNAPDNRRLFLGWMSNWQYAQKVPTEKWRSAMTLPRELFLNKTKDGYRVISMPAKECESLRTKTVTDFKSQKEYSFSLGELSVEFDLSKNASNDFGIEISNTKHESVRIGYNRVTNNFYIDRTNCINRSFSKEFAAVLTAPRQASGTNLKMHLFIDRSSVELFADNGTVVMTDIFFPEEDFSRISSYTNDGKRVPLTGKLYELISTWH